MKHSVRFIVLRYLAICDYLMPCTVKFLEKDDFFFQEIFQAGACPNLKVSQYMNFSLIICTRQRVRYLQLFALSATP